jgi:hypothetical protein
MKVTLDTEFNGFGGQLISIALVPETLDDIFYEVLPCDNPDPWVAKNVISVLNQELIHSDFSLAKSVLQHRLENWFKHIQLQTDEIEIIADWPDDIRYFCELLITGPGYMIATPKKLSFTMDRSLPETSIHSKIPHNAREDAIRLMRHIINTH